MYCPFISLSAFRKSLGWENDTKPQPLVLPVLLSCTTLAMLNEEYRFLNTVARTSSFVSLPRLPTKILQSFSGHSSIVLSCQTSPAAFLNTTFFFYGFSSFFICLVFSGPGALVGFQTYTYFSMGFYAGCGLGGSEGVTSLAGRVRPFFCIRALSLSLRSFFLSSLEGSMQLSLLNIARANQSQFRRYN